MFTRLYGIWCLRTWVIIGSGIGLMTFLSLTWESPYQERWSLYWDGVLASMDWAKTTARRDENHLSFGIWFILYQTFDGSYLLVMGPLIKKDPFFLEGGAWETLKPWFLTRACWASVVTTRPSGTNCVFILYVYAFTIMCMKAQVHQPNNLSLIFFPCVDYGLVTPYDDTHRLEWILLGSSNGLLSGDTKPLPNQVPMR